MFKPSITNTITTTTKPSPQQRNSPAMSVPTLMSQYNHFKVQKARKHTARGCDGDCGGEPAPLVRKPFPEHALILCICFQRERGGGKILGGEVHAGERVCACVFYRLLEGCLGWMTMVTTLSTRTHTGFWKMMSTTPRPPLEQARLHCRTVCVYESACVHIECVVCAHRKFPCRGSVAS